MNKDEFVESIQFNYMHDLIWLMEQYPVENRQKSLVLVHGNACEADLKQEVTLFPNVKLVKARVDSAYGTHHTKMMLLLYKSGMRVIVHTANLIEADWYQKTQG
jgi:tyrosyl-DNA phosphodiesterase 1